MPKVGKSSLGKFISYRENPQATGTGYRTIILKKSPDRSRKMMAFDLKRKGPDMSSV